MGHTVFPPVRRGDTVRVVRGRKIPVGTEGEVFWAGEGTYGWRVGLVVNGEKQFTAISNVEVVRGPTLDARAEHAQRHAEKARQRALVNPSGAERVSPAEQHAWDETWVEVWPVATSDASEAELRQAVALHNESSWGALRWRTFDYLGREQDGRARVRVVEHLCD